MRNSENALGKEAVCMVRAACSFPRAFQHVLTVLPSNEWARWRESSAKQKSGDSCPAGSDGVWRSVMGPISSAVDAVLVRSR